MEDKQEKIFLCRDHSGRGLVGTIGESHIRDWWVLETEDDSDMMLSDFLDNSEVGDTWRTYAVELIRIS